MDKYNIDILEEVMWWKQIFRLMITL
jgi:hypothetical protein